MRPIAFVSTCALAAAMAATFATAQQPGTTHAESRGIPASGHYTSFRELDTNRDGHVSRDEAKNSPAVTRRFNELDRDGNGRISPEEQRNWSFTGPTDPRR